MSPVVHNSYLRFAHLHSINVAPSLYPLAPQVFLLKHPDVPGVDRKAIQTEVLDTIFAGNMSSLYEHVCGQLGLPVDPTKLSAMRTANAQRLTELDAKVKDAEENMGDTEVREALLAKADYIASTGRSWSDSALHPPAATCIWIEQRTQAAAVAAFVKNSLLFYCDAETRSL